jgi:hypothetical protein
VLRGLAQGVTDRDRAGVERSLAIVAGLLLTTTGYVAGTLQASWRRAVRPRRSEDPAVQLETERTLS